MNRLDELRMPEAVTRLKARLDQCEPWKLAENWITLDAHQGRGEKLWIYLRDCHTRESICLGSGRREILPPLLAVIEAAREQAKVVPKKEAQYETENRQAVRGRSASGRSRSAAAGD